MLTAQLPMFVSSEGAVVLIERLRSFGSSEFDVHLSPFSVLI